VRIGPIVEWGRSKSKCLFVKRGYIGNSETGAGPRTSHDIGYHEQLGMFLTYYQLHQYEEASDLYAQILDLRLRIFGPEHPMALASMNNLACSYGNLGQLKDTSDLHAKTLNLTLKVHGPEHPYTLANMGNLAFAYLELGQFQKASELHIGFTEESARPRTPRYITEHELFGGFFSIRGSTPTSPGSTC